MYVNGHAHGGEGHNSRAFDVERTAQEISKAKFLRAYAGAGAPYRARLLAAAAASDLSDAAFRVLAIRSMYANPDGASCTVSQATIGVLLGKGERTIQRLDEELKGWAEGKKPFKNQLPFISVKQRHPGQMSAITTLVPSDDLNRIIAELCGSDPSKMAGLNSDPSNLAGLENSDPPFLSTRPVKNGGQPCSSYPDVEEEKEVTYALAQSSIVNGFKGTEVSKPLDLNLVLTAETSQQFQALANAWGAKPGEPVANPLKLDVAETFLAAELRPFEGEDPALVRNAILQVIAGMAAMVAAGQVMPGKKWNAALAYFRKALQGTIREMKRENERATIELDAVRQREAIKLDADRRASEMKLGSLGKRLEMGEAETGKRLTSGTTNATPAAPDDRFPAGKVIITVHGCLVSGEDANDILDDVPGVTRDMVRRMLKEASNRSVSLFGGSPDGFKKASIGKISEWCIHELQRDVAYIAHGRPETLCGGPVAILDGVKLQSVYGAVSQPFLDALKVKYPLAFGETIHWTDNDNGRCYRVPVECGEKAMAYAFKEAMRTFVKHRVSHLELVETCDWSKYGVSSQQAVEAAFDERVAAVQGMAQCALEENASYEARRDEKSGFRRVGDEAVMTPEFATELEESWCMVMGPNSPPDLCPSSTTLVCRYGADWRPYQAREEFEVAFVRLAGCRSDRSDRRGSYS